ncbi:NAD(P)/FAD-dependent oxidoreductase [Lentibacillus jeotgali]|uniref:NAD(P)/FAD-dependent oxidoreductase n=1 Tax=Lentibacillus jeotgali TaxID=558169 RepID=UPI0002628454|nr:FAD-dependent oxidoreductase [Lentibacillus jeotgali]
MRTDLLIVGGGPAGLNAAYKAASYGLKTIIVDKWFSLGGQLRQQTQSYDHLPQHFAKLRGYKLADFLIDRLKPLDVTILEKHTLIGAYSDGSVGVTNEKDILPIDAKNVLITTGAMEEPDIFPGWTLPGVMTAGAAQILINRERVLPGKQALILGSNEFALEVAAQLHDCGIAIKGIVENRSELLCQNEKLIARISNAEIPIVLNGVIESAIGKGKVEEAYVNHNGNNALYDVDLICVAKGITPILEPFEVMNCDLIYRERLGGWLPEYYGNFETTNPSIYVAGNAAGITNMGGILLTGEIAAISAVESLNAASTVQIKEEKEYLWNELYRIEYNSVLEARLDVINELHNEKDAQLPPLVDSLNGRLING